MTNHFGAIKLEGVDVYPARVEGLSDVYDSPNFILAKSRWMADQEAVYCVLCNNKFNQIRRKHHCRQCGRVLCSKCCKEKVPLPQLACEEPERVCESCRPITECVTKSRSHLMQFQNEAVLGIVKLCMDPHGLCKVVELGGIQTLVAMAKLDNETLLARVVNGLHMLSMHHPLHKILVEAGAIKAICGVLMRSSQASEQVIIDGISALVIFCKAPDFRSKALEDGALSCVLKICGTGESDAVSLLAVSALGLIVENQATHAKVIENGGNALGRVLMLTASSDEQMQEVSLKTLAHISMGSQWHMHRIIQEDFTSGRSLQKAIKSKPKNEQVLCNAACLISNLATSSEDQGGLQELMECLCDVLKSDTKNSELLAHVSRGIANFSQFVQNADRLMKYLPMIVFKCLKSPHTVMKMHGMRTVLHLLSYKPKETVQELLSVGASDLLEGMARLPGMTDAIQTCLLSNAPTKAKPL